MQITNEVRAIIDFHADDFGISKNSCDDIMKLVINGFIDSISILPNMTNFDYGVGQLKEYFSNSDTNLKITVHLNFMEGHCCAEPISVSSLIDSKGFFSVSWGKLFIYNYIPVLRGKIKKQLTAEIIAQTEKCLSTGLLTGRKLRFDGHQHTHMIPLVFESLLSAIEYFENKGINTEYIRNTQDPIFPYYKAKNIKTTFETINLIKCLILNFYSHKIRKTLKKLNLPPNYLCGVFFSGHMDFDRLSMVLPYYSKVPLSQNRIIELLFHPGLVLKNELGEEFVKPGFNEFHLSEGRSIEFNALEQFHK